MPKLDALLDKRRLAVKSTVAHGSDLIGFSYRWYGIC